VHGLLSIHLKSYDFGIIDEWGECFKKVLITSQSDFHRMMTEQLEECHSQIKAETDFISECVFSLS
jgi:hypothetical protein